MQGSILTFKNTSSTRLDHRPTCPEITLKMEQDITTSIYDIYHCSEV